MADMSEWAPLPLHRAGGQAGDDTTLEDHDEDDDRDRQEPGGGGDVAGRRRELRVALEERDRRRNGSGPIRRRQRDREDEVVPREDEDEDRGGEHARRGQRQDDLAKRLPRRRAVDLRGLLELPRDLPEERDERVD